MATRKTRWFCGVLYTEMAFWALKLGFLHPVKILEGRTKSQVLREAKVQENLEIIEAFKEEEKKKCIEALRFYVAGRDIIAKLSEIQLSPDGSLVDGKPLMVIDLKTSEEVFVWKWHVMIKPPIYVK